MLSVGDSFPEFSLPDQNGNIVDQKSLLGQPTVIFLYPKADTPGCTKEACSFRDLSAGFTARGVKIVGMSADTPKKQLAFANKYGLPMTLLGDESHGLLTAIGVWQEKKQYGRSYMGIVRTTYVIGPDGKVAEVFPKVKVEGHTEAVLARIEALYPRA